MTFQRGFDGSEPLRAQPILDRAGAQEDHHAASCRRLGSATLACPRCDAPVALGGRVLTPADPLACPFCRHRAPLRDFLSLAQPTRPARVVVRVRVGARASGS
jgi:hypothetical protein